MKGNNNYMRKLVYLAVFEPTKDGISVFFPDLPGCISFGQTFENAQKQAADALALHIYGMEKDGETIPESSITPVIDLEVAKGYFIVPVTIFPDLVKSELDNKKVKTNVTLPSWLKEIAEQSGVNFSKILESALIDYLNIKQNPRLRR